VNKELMNKEQGTDEQRTKDKEPATFNPQPEIISTSTHQHIIKLSNYQDLLPYKKEARKPLDH